METKEEKRVRQRTQRRLKREKGYLCPHGYIKPSYCLQCSPENICVCGSGSHRRYCCANQRWNKFGRNKQTQPAAAAPAPEPAQKMRRVMVGAVEVMVEDGATLTIAGVPISFR